MASARVVLEDIARCARLAAHGEELRAARLLIARVRHHRLSKDAVMFQVLQRLTRMRDWPQQDIEAYERNGSAYRVDIQGQAAAWIAPESFPLPLVPKLPCLSPRGLSALSRGIARVVKGTRSKGKVS